MKIAVLGAGAIGGWMAAKLHATGADVSLITRGETQKQVAAQGLQLLLKQEQQTQWIFGQSAQFFKNQGIQFDLVIVSVKSQHMGDAAADIAPLLHAKSMVLTAMNGVPWWYLQGFGGAHAGKALASVDPGGGIARRIPNACMLGCVVHASCSTDSPGVVRHHFGKGLVVGEACGGQSQRLSTVVQLLKTAQFDVTESAAIQRDIWYKLWGNMTMNPISALTGATTDQILADPQVLEFVSAVMLEAKAIGAELGIEINQTPQDRHQMTAKLGAFKTSMLQDSLAGRSIELDALVGAVVELGQLTGVAVPNTAALMGLTRLMARQQGLYPG